MQQRNISIKFLGAAGTVTGSKIYLKTPTKNILIDCGLFQGLKELRLKNWEPIPIKFSEIDLVLITHGHLDHVGFLPRLVKEGYAGKIMATPPTLDVAAIILKDSARIQEEDAERANSQGFSKHEPALPLYTTKDVENTIAHFVSQDADKWFAVDENTMVRFRQNGHIIGACFIEIKVNQKVFVFSGDVGRPNDPLMPAPDKPLMADILTIESTYGNRIHPADAENKLAEIIHQSYNANATIIIPGFAVERIQLLMYLIWSLKKSNKIPDIPVYMDSPMAKAILHIFVTHKDWHKIPMYDFKAMTENVTLVEDLEDTYKVAQKKGPKIIIAGSGMATGGRVLTYLQKYLPKRNTTILLVGYQAEGTRGRKMLDGDEEIKIFGKYVKVKAQVSNIEGLSAHADQTELLSWMNELQHKPEKIFIIHGEKNASAELKKMIKKQYGWDAEIPNMNEEFEINL